MSVQRLDPLEVRQDLLPHGLVHLGEEGRCGIKAPQSSVILEPLRISFRGEPGTNCSRHMYLQLGEDRRDRADAARLRPSRMGRQ